MSRFGLSFIRNINHTISHYRQVKIITEHVHVKHIVKIKTNDQKLPQHVVKLN